MFLISLIIFPFIAYYTFNSYKSDVKELNGATKIIGIIGLYLLIIFGYLGIFENNDSYLVIITIWYIAVFFYYYFLSINLQLKSLNKFKYNKPSFAKGIMKITFLIFIFIFCVNIIDNYQMNDLLGINNSNSLLGLIFILSNSTLLSGIIYEFFDMIKDSFFRIIINGKSSRHNLKQELKAEILMELKAEK